MAIDPTVTIGNLIEICSIIGGGLLVLLTLRTDVRDLKNGATAMQAEIKRLSDILVELANVRGELKVLDVRLTAQEQDIREMRHGDGFVLPRK